MEEAVRLIVAMWTESRTSFHGKYFHVEDAILEPKPAQKPRPPIMIAGGGEQLTLRYVARLADLCNVGGEPDGVRHKLDVLRRHCDVAQRDYSAIEKTNIISVPATMPPSRRNASGCRPAGRYAVLSARRHKPSIWSVNTRTSA